MKTAVALSVGRQVFLSQHIGDLETPEAMNALRRVIADFLRLYEARPALVAHDLHPGYPSTLWAEEWAIDHGIPSLAVQHHHAHLVSCLAENGVPGPAPPAGGRAVGRRAAPHGPRRSVRSFRRRRSLARGPPARARLLSERADTSRADARNRPERASDAERGPPLRSRGRAPRPFAADALRRPGRDGPRSGGRPARGCGLAAPARAARGRTRPAGLGAPPTRPPRGSQARR